MISVNKVISVKHWLFSNFSLPRLSILMGRNTYMISVNKILSVKLYLTPVIKPFKPYMIFVNKTLSVKLLPTQVIKPYGKKYLHDICQ